MAKMRLIAAGFTQGHYDAAVEITLTPTAHTYWRQPGEAGVPPVFSFAGSTNVARTEVLYPAPQRFDEAGLTTFGYKGGVTFPIRVWPQDATTPTRLNLSLDYAVCDRLCVPAKGRAALVLPRSGASPETRLFAAAQAQVPIGLSKPEMADKFQIRAAAADKGHPQWSLVWKGKEPISGLFVEGPDGWFFASRMTAKDVFSLAAVEAPATPKGHEVVVRLTFTGPDKAFEASLPLGLAKSDR